MDRERPTTLLIADDHPVVRQGVVSIVDRDPDFRVVAQTGHGDDVFPLLQDCQPDIALLDVALPGCSGLDILERVRSERFPVRVVLLTMYNDEGFVERATHLDARGYLLKDNSPAELLRCLRTVRDGRYYYSPEVAGGIVERIHLFDGLREQFPGLNELTSAERRILVLISENRTSREIAEELFLSVRTVQNHRHHICGKLGLSGFHSLLQFALEHKTALMGFLPSRSAP